MPENQYAVNLKQFNKKFSAKLLDHPHFDEAVDDLLDKNEERMPFRRKDVSDVVVLVWLFSDICELGIENDKIVLYQSMFEDNVWNHETKTFDEIPDEEE
jgi:hypothetical protein